MVKFWTRGNPFTLAGKTRAMYSSEDLERFYVEYQSEWVPRGKLPGEKSARWMYIPMPGGESRRLVGGTKASPELLQALAYETYVKRVSLGNLLQQLQDIGMRISKNTLCNWLKKGKRHLDSTRPLFRIEF